MDHTVTHRRRTAASLWTTARLAMLASLGTAVCLAGPAADATGPAGEAIIAPLADRSLLLDVAVADGTVVAVGERGHILRSTDRGASWAQVPVPTRAMLTGVCFRGPELGWAVGHDAVILRSTDGGGSWELVYSDPELESPLIDVWFADAERGFAIGAYGTFLVTTDGGETWEQEWISEDDFHLHHLARAADGTLYIAAEAGVIYRSDDDGATWSELPSPYEGSFFGVLPLSGDTVLLFGLRGHLFRSDDRGETWAPLQTDTVAMLTSALDLGGGRVVVAGLGGVLLWSADGGRSFSLEARPDRLGISALVALDDGSLVVVGEGGVRTLAPETRAGGQPGGDGGAS